MLFLPLTFLTGVSLNWSELWQASHLLGQRLLETEVSSYLQLATLAAQGKKLAIGPCWWSATPCAASPIWPPWEYLSAAWWACVPSRRADILSISWKALWAATLATLMIGSVAGLYDTGNPAILGR